MRKNDFLALLGHELRNPLAAITWGLRLLASPQSGPDAKERALPVVMEQAAYMERLIDDLLDVAQLSQGRATLHKKVLAVQEPLRAAVEMCRDRIEAGNFVLAVGVPSAPLRVVADGIRLTQIFVNLIDNALKYSGGSRRIEVSAESHEGWAVVRIRDYGQGIAAELLPHVFEPYVQGPPAGAERGGIGMGLAVVRELVLQHGGSVRAFSAGENRGSEFVVRLPACAPPARKPRRRPRRSA